MANKMYFRKIDVLRLFLCAGVLLYHLEILKGGYLAVSSFFVLSGFLSIVSFRSRKKPDLKSYYLGRLRRIYLPLLAVAFIFVGVISLVDSINWIELKPETTSVIFAYNNFWQLLADQDYFTRHSSSPFMHMWYIAILIQYDLLLPFFHLLMRKAAKKVSRLFPMAASLLLAIVSFVVFAIHISHGRVMNAYYGSFERAFSMLLGMAAGYGFRSLPSLTFKSEKIGNVIFAFYMVLLAGLFVFVNAESKLFSFAMIFVSIITLRMIAYAVQKSDRKKTGERILYLLSDMSYKIYLVQYPLIYLLSYSHLPAFIQKLLAVILTLLLSYLLHVVFHPSRKRNMILQILLSALVLIGSLFGFYRYITAKDYSKEIKELKEKLQENEKMIEEKNKEYLHNSEEEEEELLSIFRDMDNKEEAVSQYLAKAPVTGIGDSILIDIADEMYVRFPNGYFDGRVSRDLYAGEDILRDMKEEGTLSDIIVLCLATNGDYIESCNEELMNIVEDRQVFWVDAVGADDPEFNERFASFAENYDNLHIVEWEKASEGHPEYFYYDNIHVMEDGVGVLADLVYDTVYNVYLENYSALKEAAIKESEARIEKRVAFYGNDALISAYGLISEKFERSICNGSSDYDFDALYAQIKEKKENGTLEHRVVFLFDRTAGFTLGQYEKLIRLCEGHDVYICRMDKKEYDLKEDAKVIDFYAAIENNADYLMGDGVHLSEKGNVALADMIGKAIGE